LRLLFFLPDFGGGGSQRTLINLANALTDQGHRVTIGTALAGGPAAAWVNPAVEVAELGRRRIRSTPIPLAGLIRRIKPDLVLASGVDANIAAWAACLLLGRGRPPLLLRETNSHRARDELGPLRRLLCAFAYRAADHIVALSEGVRNELIELYSLKPDRVSTIHNPVEVERAARDVKMARSLLPSPVAKPRPLIVGMGRLTRQKGFDRLIPMVAGLDRPDLQLALLGEGEDRGLLAALAVECGLNGRLHLPGFVSDPSPWLAHATLFVLPSRWEGFGHVIVEAMAAGVPVIAYDCPHGPRDIIRDGVNGVLVRMDDEQGFMRAMNRMLDDRNEAKRMADAASEVVWRFGVDRISRDYLRLFRRIAGQSETIRP
jgi:glycosyltransferase involved in cell wall biosynthesis